MKINYLILLLICWRPKLPNFFPFFWSRQSPVYLKEEKNIHSIFFQYFLLWIVIKFPVDSIRCLKLTDLIHFLPTISPLRSSFLEEFKLKTKSLLFPVKKGKFETKCPLHYKPKPCTVFPHIVSAETILFWLLPYVLWPLITVHKCAETIQGRKLFKGGNYMRKYGI